MAFYYVMLDICLPVTFLTIIVFSEQYTSKIFALQTGLSVQEIKLEFVITYDSIKEILKKKKLIRSK